jgi:hypothetical protein
MGAASTYCLRFSSAATLKETYGESSSSARHTHLAPSAAKRRSPPSRGRITSRARSASQSSSARARDAHRPHASTYSTSARALNVTNPPRGDRLAEAGPSRAASDTQRSITSCHNKAAI